MADASAAPKAEAVLSVEFGEFCKRFFVRWVFGIQPAVGVVGFGVWVDFRVTGKGEVDGVDDSAFG